MLHVVKSKTVTKHKGKGRTPVAGATIQSHPRKSVVDELEKLKALLIGQSRAIHNNRLSHNNHHLSCFIVSEGRRG